MAGASTRESARHEGDHARGRAHGKPRGVVPARHRHALGRFPWRGRSERPFRSGAAVHACLVRRAARPRCAAAARAGKGGRRCGSLAARPAWTRLAQLQQSIARRCERAFGTRCPRPVARTDFARAQQTRSQGRHARRLEGRCEARPGQRRASHRGGRASGRKRIGAGGARSSGGARSRLRRQGSARGQERARASHLARRARADGVGKAAPGFLLSRRRASRGRQARPHRFRREARRRQCRRLAQPLDARAHSVRCQAARLAAQSRCLSTALDGGHGARGGRRATSAFRPPVCASDARRRQACAHGRQLCLSRNGAWRGDRRCLGEGGRASARALRCRKCRRRASHASRRHPQSRQRAASGARRKARGAGRRIGLAGARPSLARTKPCAHAHVHRAGGEWTARGRSAFASPLCAR